MTVKKIVSKCRLTFKLKALLRIEAFLVVSQFLSDRTEPLRLAS